MQLDAGFVEALMNYAAVNLSFRGFKNAEDAYRQALKARPKDYDAVLGLALAIRGQINDANWDKNVKEAQALIDQAKQLAPERPEAYYNLGIIYMRRGEYARARPLLARALERGERIHGPNHPAIAATLVALGGVEDRITAARAAAHVHVRALHTHPRQPGRGIRRGGRSQGLRGRRQGGGRHLYGRRDDWRTGRRDGRDGRRGHRDGAAPAAQPHSA